MVNSTPPRRKFTATFRKKVSNADKPFINIQIGIAYENNDGHIDLVMNAIPIGEWDGKIKLWANDPPPESDTDSE